jgi:hypothetical protein
VAVDASGFHTEEAEAKLDTMELNMGEDEGATAAGEELTMIMLLRARFVNPCSINLGIAVPKSLYIGPLSRRYTTMVT